MALNFPSSPISGQTYQSGSSPYYIFNGNYWEIDKSYVVNGSSGTSGTSGESGSSGSNGTSGTSGSSGIAVSASYMRGSRSTQQTSGLTTNSVVIFTQTDNSTGSDISLNTSTGRITLAANKTYRLIGMVPNFTTSGGDVRPQFCWYNETTSAYIGSSAGGYVPSSGAGFGSFGGHAEAVITTNVTTVISFRFLVGSSSLAAIGGNSDFSSTGSYPWFDIEVISGYSPLVNGSSGTSGTSGSNGSSGTSGTSGSNGSSGTSGTSGSSGSSVLTTVTGTTSTGDLNVSGNLGVTGTTTFNSLLTLAASSGDEGGEILLAKAITNTTLTGSGITIDSYRDRLRIFEQGGNARGVYFDLSKAPAGVAGELTWKTSGFVAAGTFVTMDNLKVAVTTSGSRGLSIGAVSTSFEADVSGWYTVPGGSGGGSANNITYTTTAAGSAFGWNFGAHGDMVQVNIRDKTNSRFYRVTMMIGASYLSNFISIERLH